MSVLNISNIIGGRNIASNLIGNGESTANPITPTTRFLEKGDYFKLGNATINYNLGNIGRSIKNANIYYQDPFHQSELEIFLQIVQQLY